MDATHHTDRAPRRRRTRDPRPGALLLTLSQASAETGVPSTSLRDLIARGHLPAVRLGDTRRVWVRRCDLAALVERSVVRGAA